MTKARTRAVPIYTEAEQRIRNTATSTAPWLDEDDFKTKRLLAELAFEDGWGKKGGGWIALDRTLNKGSKQASKKGWMGTLPTAKHGVYKPAQRGFFMRHTSGAVNIGIRATIMDMFHIGVAHADEDGVLGGWKIGNEPEMVATRKHRDRTLQGGSGAANIEGEGVKEVLGIEFPKSSVRGLLEAWAAKTEYGNGLGDKLDPPKPTANGAPILAGVMSAAGPGA